jgi:hypothetical protein
MRWRNRLMSAGKGGKMLLGGVLTAAGLLVLLGLDRKFETWLTQLMPPFLVDLSGKY